MGDEDSKLSARCWTGRRRHERRRRTTAHDGEVVEKMLRRRGGLQWRVDQEQLKHGKRFEFVLAPGSGRESGRYNKYSTD